MVRRWLFLKSKCFIVAHSGEVAMLVMCCSKSNKGVLLLHKTKIYDTIINLQGLELHQMHDHLLHKTASVSACAFYVPWGRLAVSA